MLWDTLGTVAGQSWDTPCDQWMIDEDFGLVDPVCDMGNDLDIYKDRA